MPLWYILCSTCCLMKNKIEIDTQHIVGGDLVMYVIKKDGTREEFNVDKIIAAVNKSAARILYEFSTDEIAFICQFAYDRAESLKKTGSRSREMHNIVERCSRESQSGSSQKLS